MSVEETAEGGAEYLNFRTRVFGSFAREDEGDGQMKHFGELELQSRWFAGHFGNEFTGVDGEEVEICDFGHWNHSAGPDFQDCAVMLDGELRRGSIELDPDVRDWERHGHGKNAEYDGVVLHLFTRATGKGRFFTRNSAHKQIAQVRLDPSVLAEFSGRQYAEARLGRCADPLKEMDLSKIDGLLEAAARFRMRRKGERLAQTTSIHGADQTLFQGIAEALGYRKNRQQMLVLAQRFPLKKLLAEKETAEAILFGAAGFLNADIFEKAGPDEQGYLRSLWEAWWKKRSEISEVSLDWNFSGTRPGNHPHRRLGALVALLAKWKAFSGLVFSGDGFGQKPVANFFDGLKHEFWSQHYTLTSSVAKKPISLVGATRVSDILANQIYPLLIRDNPRLWQAYKQMPARLENEKVRRACARLFGEQGDQRVKINKVYQQQGLLQVYADFCLEDSSGCDNCPFPEQLQDW